VFYSDHPWANVTSQSINYVAAHDNHTLFDKLKSVNHSVPEEEIIAQNKLADAIVMTCQGIPFIHAGSEFLRTKHGDENSYRSGDRVNQLDWDLKTKNIDVFRYYQGLIALRKSRKAFRMNLAQDVQNNIIFYGTEQSDSLRLRDRNVVAYLLTNHANGDDEGTILVAINGNRESITLDLPAGQWKVLVDKEKAGSEPFGIVTATDVTIPGTSILVLSSTKVVEARTGLATPVIHVKTARRILAMAPRTALVAYFGRTRKKVS
jgi:pullulanase